MAELTAAEDELEGFVSSGDFGLVPRANRRFHSVINEAAGNPGALSLVDLSYYLIGDRQTIQVS